MDSKEVDSFKIGPLDLAGQLTDPLGSMCDKGNCNINDPNLDPNTEYTDVHESKENILGDDTTNLTGFTPPKRKHPVNNEPLDFSFSPSSPKHLREIKPEEDQYSNDAANAAAHGYLDSPQDTHEDFESHSNEAAEIVKKLCKNGKVMQFQEGEDYIKVIVYEDSQENDAEETLSAEEIESICDTQGHMLPDLKTTHAGGFRSQNLLERLTQDSQREQYFSDRGQNEIKYTSSATDLRCRSSCSSQTCDVNSNSDSEMSHQGSQWYEGMFSTSSPMMVNHPTNSTMTPAAAIQSNFANTVNQFAPSFLTCNKAEMASIPQQSGRENQHAIPVSGNQKMFCTPHPKNGYMFYVNEDSTNTPVTRRTPLAPLATTSMYRSNIPATLTPATGRMVTPASQNVRLNSSGEENVSPTDTLDMTPSSHSQLQHKVRSLIALPQFTMDDSCKIREQHNQKERRRRARIKEACNLLRQLVPGMSDKTDKATVFEFAARYVHFLKSHTGTQFDKDFLMKYSPY